MRPGAILGGLVGFLLTLPLTVVFFLVAALVGTSIVPYAMFDWTVQNFPGALINFGKEIMIGILTTLSIGELSSTAKIAENLMGIIGMLATGVIAGAIFFAYMKSRDEAPRSKLPGVILGLILGIPVTLVTLQVYFTATAPAPVNVIVVAARFWRLGGAHAGRFRAAHRPSTRATAASHCPGYGPAFLPDPAGWCISGDHAGRRRPGGGFPARYRRCASGGEQYRDRNNTLRTAAERGCCGPAGARHAP